MLPPELATETVTRLRGTLGNNGYDDQVIDWSSPDQLAIRGCSVQPEIGQEVLLSRDATVSRWRFYGPLDADLTSLDRIRHLGTVYDVDGSVQRWPDIFGLGHSTCLLRRADG